MCRMTSEDQHPPSTQRSRVRSWVGRLSSPTRAFGKQASATASGLDCSKIRADIARALHDQTHDDGSLAPLLIRFTWHACGTYDRETNTGGSDGGTIWLPAESNDAENKGFDKARKLLKQLHTQHSHLSLADVTVLAGCVAIEATGGPHIPFATGRRDFDHAAAVAKHGGEYGGCPFGDGKWNPSGSRLPAADLGPAPNCSADAPATEREAPTINAVRGTFARLGFSDRETVCLVVLGHQYGRCHPDVSGFEFPWYVFDPTHYNIYEHGLGFLSAFTMAEGAYREQVNSTGKRQWNMRMSFAGPEPFMMLPSDMALVFDPTYRAALEHYDRDRVAFRTDAAAAFRKLTELGCDGLQPEL